MLNPDKLHQSEAEPNQQRYDGQRQILLKDMQPTIAHLCSSVSNDELLT